jgi:hypothetical protein
VRARALLAALLLAACSIAFSLSPSGRDLLLSLERD